MHNKKSIPNNNQTKTKNQRKHLINKHR